MSSPNAIIAHPAVAVAEELAEALERAGFQVLHCTDGEELERRAAATPPEVALVALELLESGDLLHRWRSRSETREVPLVALAGAGKGEHRRALRLRLTNVVQEPLEGEDVVLAAWAAAGIDPPAGEPLRGSLETLPPADLLSMVELHRRSGRLEFASGEVEGFIEYDGGQIVDAALHDGRRDDDAVEAILELSSGTFEARLSARGARGAPPAADTPGPAPVEDDERSRRERQARELWGDGPRPAGNGAAGSEDRRAVHTALTLMNILGSFASGVAGARSVTRVLDETHRRLSRDYPALERFKVLDSASVSLHRSGEGSGDQERIVAGVSEWSRAVIRALEDRLPGRFSPATARMVLASIQPELERHGFRLLAGEEDDR